MAEQGEDIESLGLKVPDEAESVSAPIAMPAWERVAETAADSREGEAAEAQLSDEEVERLFLTAVFDDVRAQSADAKLVQPSQWLKAGLVPAHFSAEDWEMFVYEYLEDRRAERDARVVAASATPVRTATRAVGVPRILRTEEEPESEGAATAKGAEEPRQPERSSEASEELRHPERSAEGAEPKDPATSEPSATPASLASEESPEPPVIIAHMLPDLLNLYGDGGNVRILEQRLRWRGIPVEVRRIQHGEAVDFSQVDLVFMGGGPDREQKLASEQLLAMRDELAVYVEGDGPLLAICGGYQILGRQWLWGDELVAGLGLIDMETRRPGTSADRLIDNMVLESPLAAHPVVGYENHAGRTYLGEGVEGFGRVVSSCGHGNNDDDRVEGARYKNVVGTYSHGPLLSKNPEVADWLLARALERRAERTGTPAADLAPLDDGAELAANASMVKRLS